MAKFKFNLSDKVKDRITGFKGVVVARTEYMTGCRRYSLQDPKLSKDGKPQDWQAFDEDSLEFDGKIKHKIKRPGGVVKSDPETIR